MEKPIKKTVSTMNGITTAFFVVFVVGAIFITLAITILTGIFGGRNEFASNLLLFIGGWGFLLLYVYLHIWLIDSISMNRSITAPIYAVLAINAVAVGSYFSYKVFNNMRKAAAEEQKITLTQPEKVAGILMPAGTKLTFPKLSNNKDLFSMAIFPEPVIWNNAPVTEIFWSRTLLDRQQIGTKIEGTFPYGDIEGWSCDHAWWINNSSENSREERFYQFSSCSLTGENVIYMPGWNNPNLTLPSRDVSLQSDLTKPNNWIVSLDSFAYELDALSDSSIPIRHGTFHMNGKTVQSFDIEFNYGKDERMLHPDCAIEAQYLHKMSWTNEQPNILTIGLTADGQNRFKLPASCFGKRVVEAT